MYKHVCILVTVVFLFSLALVGCDKQEVSNIPYTDGDEVSADGDDTDGDMAVTEGENDTDKEIGEEAETAEFSLVINEIVAKATGTDGETLLTG